VTPASNFAEQVIYVLEIRTRRWRYWDSLWEKACLMSDKEVLIQLGWPKQCIAHEYLLALNELLGD
jgi:hypothetical protein